MQENQMPNLRGKAFKEYNKKILAFLFPDGKEKWDFFNIGRWSKAHGIPLEGNPFNRAGEQYHQPRMDWHRGWMAGVRLED